MKYRIGCRWVRRENGRLVSYPAGSVLDLDEKELRKLRLRAVAVEDEEVEEAEEEEDLTLPLFPPFYQDTDSD